MKENLSHISDEEMLGQIVSSVETPGREAKRLLISILNNKVQEIPQIDVWPDSSGPFLEKERIEAITLNRGGIVSENGKNVFKPWEVLTKEGIFVVPVLRDSVWISDDKTSPAWDKRREIIITDYPLKARGAMEAINKVVKEQREIHDAAMSS